MRVLSLRMLGEISGAAVQWKASWGAEEEILGMLFLRDLCLRSLRRSWNPTNECGCVCVCDLTFFRTAICFKSFAWKFLYIILLSYCIPSSDDNFRAG